MRTIGLVKVDGRYELNFNPYTPSSLHVTLDHYRVVRCPVMGYQYYPQQEQLLVGENLLLQHDKANEYSTHAVKIVRVSNGACIGYVPDCISQRVQEGRLRIKKACKLVMVGDALIPYVRFELN